MCVQFPSPSSRLCESNVCGISITHELTPNRHKSLTGCAVKLVVLRLLPTIGEDDGQSCERAVNTVPKRVIDSSSLGAQRPHERRGLGYVLAVNVVLNLYCGMTTAPPSLVV
jgi:hypothetical protein